MADNDAKIPYTILTEWLPRGSLDAILYGPKKVELNGTQKMRIVVGILLGMKYIHACGLMHRDLKPGNVLMTKNLEAKIGDLGSAKRYDISTSFTMGGGTAAYMAPEQSGDDPYGNAVDVFAFGFILWEIVKGQQVFKELAGRGPLVIHNRVCQQHRPPLTGVPDEIGKLMVRCWDHDPKHRPTFDTIFKEIKALNYQLFDDVDAKAIEKYIGTVAVFEARNPPKPLTWGD
jgi:serine/threonine protein kinase